MAPVDPALLRSEQQSLPSDCKLAEAGGLAVYLARANQIPHILTEICRLREITFRAAGEGSGQAYDRDRFDDHYLHLFLWNDAASEIAGAYRLVRTSTLRSGAQDLYTATLFSYGQEFLDRLGPAIELGRSFVRAEYQRSFAPLLLLWKGIGRYLSQHPECRVLFGPVSISSRYQNLSRELMVSYLQRRAPFTELLGMVASKRPFRAMQEAPAHLDLDDLSDLIADIEPDGRGVPVLLRQYLKLGGRLLGFNLDPDFSNTLDGLIVVDLCRTERSLLARYLGAAEAAAFCNYHQEDCVPRASRR